MSTAPSMGRGDIAPRLSSFRSPVAKELTLVDRKLSRLLLNGGGLIDEICSHVLSTQGKKFRPTLLLLTAEVAGDSSEGDRIAAAAIVELIHIATLIHDDTIDKSATRRGKPTVNSLWSEEIAILMGDYMYSKAFTALAGMKMFTAMEVLARSTHSMTVGEMLQIEYKHNLDITEGDYITVIDNKTASLIAAACEIGAMVAGRHDGDAEVFSSFGRQVGLAFQIVDDILDFTGDERILGKPRGCDVKGGDITLPLIAAMRNAPEADRSRLKELASSAGDLGDGFDELVRLMQRTGGIDYARATAARYARTAKGLLSEFEGSPCREALFSAVDYVIHRSF
jgi:octaprenyl-diphosphate synthase